MKSEMIRNSGKTPRTVDSYQFALKLGFIGIGRAGAALASAFRQAGYEIGGITVRSAESKERADARLAGIPQMEAAQTVKNAQVVFLTVADDEIEPLTNTLAARGVFMPGQLVVHVSGAKGLDALQAAKAVGALTVAMHPAMTFTGFSLDVQRLKGIPLAITADPLALPLALVLAEAIEAVPFQLDEAKRALYHGALTYGANYLVTLVAGARRMLAEAGIEAPEIVLRPLLQAALENSLEAGIEALTGPLLRGDETTLNSHRQVLANTPALRDLEEAYDFLAEQTKTELQMAASRTSRNCEADQCLQQ